MPPKRHPTVTFTPQADFGRVAGPVTTSAPPHSRGGRPDKQQRAPRPAAGPPTTSNPSVKAAGKPDGAAVAADAKRGAREEVDALFVSVKAKKKSKPPTLPPPPPTTTTAPVTGSLDDVFGDGSTCANRAGRKRTEEGWLVYSEEELRLGAGGGTEACPFDCDCCY